jgi:hypothetical protein
MSSNDIFISFGGFLGLSGRKESKRSGTAGDSGVSATESRVAGRFGKLKSLFSGDVVVHHGDADGIVVEADKNIVPLVRTEIQGDTLVISSAVSYSTSRPVKVAVTVSKSSRLPDLELIGSGDISMHGIDQAELSVNLKGSGDVSLSGAATRVKLSLMGSGDIDARRLKGEDVTIDLLGSGDIEASSSEKVSVTLVGSGDVDVTGSPKTVKSSSLGSGNLSIR